MFRHRIGTKNIIPSAAGTASRETISEEPLRQLSQITSHFRLREVSFRHVFVKESVLFYWAKKKMVMLIFRPANGPHIRKSRNILAIPC